jgi:spore coat polysaccharide biosynthesis protein SpsF
MPTAAIVLQARMGSVRLPGKVLAQIGGRSVLAHCIERLRLHSGLPVVVATTELPDDDRLAAEAACLGASMSTAGLSAVARMTCVRPSASAAPT